MLETLNKKNENTAQFHNSPTHSFECCKPGLRYRPIIKMLALFEAIYLQLTWTVVLNTVHWCLKPGASCEGLNIYLVSWGIQTLACPCLHKQTQHVAHHTTERYQSGISLPKKWYYRWQKNYQDCATMNTAVQNVSQTSVRVCTWQQNAYTGT